MPALQRRDDKSKASAFQTKAHTDAADLPPPPPDENLAADSPNVKPGSIQMEAANVLSHWANQDESSVRAAAAHGTAGQGGALPHMEEIQRSFGHHDVSQISAHVGGSAEQATKQMNAEAYATGDDVAFRGTPDLHTAAHEAAHVVQQRGGVNLEGGVGQEGDCYEQHADEVADAVVAGRSAAGLLDEMAGGPSVQRKQSAMVQRRSASSAALHEGAQGPDVQELQEKLNKHGANLNADGQFGPKTTAAVKAFQLSAGLTADGVVGPMTWSALDAGAGAGAGEHKTEPKKEDPKKEDPKKEEPKKEEPKKEEPKAAGKDGKQDDPGHKTGGTGDAVAEGEWGAMYGSHRTRGGTKDSETFKEDLGTIKAASEQISPGQKIHKITSDLTLAEMFQIFPGLKLDSDQDPNLLPKVQKLVDEMNTGFRIMRIDTVESRAAYLGNAYCESNQFRNLTETALSQKYESDPKKAKLDENWLNNAPKNGYGLYAQGGDINPDGNWHHSFIGRGAVQVTFRESYVQAICVMEKRAEDLEKQGDPQSMEDAKRLREAANAIKADPEQAANPDYSFLFTSAYWKMPDFKGNTGDSKANNGNIFGHMGDVQPLRKQKTDAYQRAYEVMSKKLEKEQEAAESAKAQGAKAGA